MYCVNVSIAILCITVDNYKQQYKWYNLCIYDKENAGQYRKNLQNTQD